MLMRLKNGNAVDPRSVHRITALEGRGAGRSPDCMPPRVLVWIGGIYVTDWERIDFDDMAAACAYRDELIDAVIAAIGRPAEEKP